MEKETGTIERIRQAGAGGSEVHGSYAPVLFISALTGQRARTACWTRCSRCTRSPASAITTGVLNDVLADAQASLQPPATSGRRLKIYYATQQSALSAHLCHLRER